MTHHLFGYTLQQGHILLSFTEGALPTSVILGTSEWKLSYPEECDCV